MNIGMQSPFLEEMDSIDPCLIGIRVTVGTTTIPGTYVAEATIPEFGAPIGVSYFREIGNNSIEIVYSFVNDTYRRKGVRTIIHKEIIEMYAGELLFITSREGNSKSSPWFKKNGFKQDRVTLDWVLSLTKNKKPVTKKKPKKTQSTLAAFHGF